MTHSPRQHARAAGVLYLVTHVTSVTAVLAYNAHAIPAGVTLELALAIGCLGTGVLLWNLLRAHGPARAATFALMRTVEAAVIIAGTLPLLGASWAEPDGGAMTDAATQTHTAAFLLGQGLVISVNTIVLGWLLWDSRTVPRALGALGMAGGAIVLTSNMSQLWGTIPLNGTIAGAAAVPIFAFELWLAFTLILIGLRPRHTPTTPTATEADGTPLEVRA